MYWEDRIEAGNQDYQRVLATSLIRSMGIVRALHNCQANGWDGVLDRVLSYGDNDKSPAN